MIRERKIVVAITGASGSIYAKLLLDHLATLTIKVDLVLSSNASTVWNEEILDNSQVQDYAFTCYKNTDFYAPFASGSAKYDTMILVPCSMGTLGRIAGGISNDLITRAADVMLKERRKLILVTRETPLNLIHINNMKTVTEAGGIICPATPSFYSKPRNIEEVANTVVQRILDLADLPEMTKSNRWQQ